MSAAVWIVVAVSVLAIGAIWFEVRREERERRKREQSYQALMEQLQAEFTTLAATMAREFVPALQKAGAAFKSFAEAWSRLPEDVREAVRKLDEDGK